MEQKEQKQQLPSTQGKSPLKEYFGTDLVKQKFTEIMGKKAPGFIASVLQVASSNDLLAKAEPASIFNAAATAAVLDLPINPNLGFAYIVPYKGKAQFQMGYRGFVQLAQRSGLFETIGVAPVFYEDTDEDVLQRLTAIIPKKPKTDIVIGYAAYFKLLNGFNKSFYMTKEDLLKHGTKYSQSFKKGEGLWKDDFDSMAGKTVLKLLLSKYAPLSIEMQRAVLSDQAVINDYERSEFDYADNKAEVVEFEELEKAFNDKGDFLPAEEQIAIERIIKNKEKESYKKAKAILDRL